MRAEVCTPRRFSSRKQPGKNHRPQQARIRKLIARSAHQIGHRFGAPDGADQWIENVIHGHAPARDVAERRMQLAPHVGVSRTRAGIHPRHAPVTHGREHHGNHGNQNRGNHVALAGVAENSVRRHGRRRLNHDDAVKDEVPKRQRAAEPGRGEGRRGSIFHESLLNYAGVKMSILKRFCKRFTDGRDADCSTSSSLYCRSP